MLISAKNIEDIHFIQDKASALNCTDFEDWVKENCTYREINDILIEFEYRSITATMDKDNESLTQAYDCYDEYHREYLGVLYCEVVEFN